MWALCADDDNDAFEGSPRTNRSKGRPDQPVQLDWVDEMQRFFTGTISESNLKSTIRVIRKLASGEGIDHPQKVATFRRGVPVRIDDDVETLIAEADNFLPREEDKSRGWKLLHPLRKMQRFQEVYYERRESASSGSVEPGTQLAVGGVDPRDESDSDDAIPLGQRRPRPARDDVKSKKKRTKVEVEQSSEDESLASRLPGRRQQPRPQPPPPPEHERPPPLKPPLHQQAPAQHLQQSQDPLHQQAQMQQLLAQQMQMQVQLQGMMASLQQHISGSGEVPPPSGNEQ